jgi:predicted enzyme related to lactoylglutathione lyase
VDVEESHRPHQHGPAVRRAHLDPAFVAVRSSTGTITLCTPLFDWRVEHVRVGSGSYLALDLAHGVQGGVVERESDRPARLPYVEVADFADATERATLLGAAVLLEPREGRAGWRSVVAVPGGAEVALWQPKP